ncbi:MAG: 3-methyladenine DNA glycosylase AlkD [Bacteroidia bacterium]|jgi:3-methyladenine DNA glycosylase AlkD
MKFLHLTYAEVIARLEELANPEKIEFKRKKFGVLANNSLGVMHSDIKPIAQAIGRNDAMALELFDGEIYEGRLLCSKIFQPKNVTSQLAEKWVKTFENWEICDSFCMGLIAKSPLAVAKIKEWVQREAEFERRAGFAVMAAYCMGDKKADNSIYESFLPIIETSAQDDRVYGKKAVHWALRSVGKQNIALKEAAIACSKRLLEFQSESKSAVWIGKDALRELGGEKPNVLDYPRHIYRLS